MTDRPKDRSPAATGDYSATKAPENAEHVTSAKPTADLRQRPGGAHGAPVDVGMSELHREDVPGEASDLGLAHYGKNPAKEREGSGKE
jgi:hypothetical protein